MDTRDRALASSENARALPARVKDGVIVLLAVATVGGLLAGLTGVLHARADGDQAAVPTRPVAVRTMRVERQDTVERREVYVGQIEAARANRVAFELSGTIAEVLVDEDDTVLEGDAIARLDTAMLDASRAALVAERAALDAEVELARLTMNRREEFNRLGYTSAQTYDEARLEHDRSNARRRQVVAAIRMVDVDLRKSVLRAPFDGRVTVRHLDDGAIVTPGAAVLDLIEDSRPQLRVGVPEDVAADLGVGEVLAADTSTGPARGTVTAIRADIDPRTRTRIVLLDLDARDVVFGSTAEVLFPRPLAIAGFWIPMTALRESGRGLWSVLSVESGRDPLVVGSESVEVLFLDGERAFVRGTLADGMEIVAGGTHRLVPGSEVTRLAEEG